MDLILESVDEFLGRAHTVHINDERASADVKLTALVATGANGRSVGIDGVGGNGFVSLSNVESRESGLMSLHVSLAGNNVGRELGRVCKCLLNLPGGNMKKEITIAIIVNATRNDQLRTGDDSPGFGIVVCVGDGDGIVIGVGIKDGFQFSGNGTHFTDITLG